MSHRSHILIKITKLEQSIADLEVKLIREKGASRASLEGLIRQEKAALYFLQDRLQEIDRLWIEEKEAEISHVREELQGMDPGERRRAEDQIRELSERINKRKQSHEQAKASH